MRRAWDGVFVGLAALHGAALVAVPSAPLIAIGIWWNSNTIAHNFIHRPFFRARALNLIFSACQSVLIGIPQTLWRERHLAHHADVRWHARWSGQLAVEAMLVVALWIVLATVAPTFFLWAYLPGYAIGLVLCALQGRYEHVGEVTTSHYGRIYNWLCFNDGYHVEHHAYPGVHWTELPARSQPAAASSRWPPLLRWLDAIDLEALERIVLRSRWLQRVVVAVHRAAFRAVLADLGPVQRVAIVGGGLFPRTAIVLHELVPDAELVIIDANARNLHVARAFIERSGGTLRRAVSFRHERFSVDRLIGAIDLIVIPLAFEGDREAIYARPPACPVAVHDWLWRVRGRSRVVSVFLLKRLNLMRGVGAGPRACPVTGGHGGPPLHPTNQV